MFPSKVYPIILWTTWLQGDLIFVVNKSENSKILEVSLESNATEEELTSRSRNTLTVIRKQITEKRRECTLLLNGIEPNERVGIPSVSLYFSSVFQYRKTKYNLDKITTTEFEILIWLIHSNQSFIGKVYMKAAIAALYVAMPVDYQ